MAMEMGDWDLVDQVFGRVILQEHRSQVVGWPSVSMKKLPRTLPGLGSDEEAVSCLLTSQWTEGTGKSQKTTSSRRDRGWSSLRRSRYFRKRKGGKWSGRNHGKQERHHPPPLPRGTGVWKKIEPPFEGAAGELLFGCKNEMVLRDWECGEGNHCWRQTMGTRKQNVRISGAWKECEMRQAQVRQCIEQYRD